MLVDLGAGSALLRDDVRSDLDAFERHVVVVPAAVLDRPEDLVPMAGRWEAVGDGIGFAARLPFAPGTVYAVARRDVDSSGIPMWSELGRLLLPTGTNLPAPVVEAIEPDVVEVPENLLRLSVSFSAPMDEGSASGGIHLLDSAGAEVDHALLPMPPELWDQPRRRLTVLLEPGRIKRGLVPNLALGSPLARRTSIDVVVQSSLRSATGADLADGARRSYRVGPAIRTRVDPTLWTVQWPPSASVSALIIDFDRPLDRPLTMRALTIADRAGALIPGRATLASGQIRWSFAPDAPWPDGTWMIHVDRALEDLAGNSVRRVFDRDLRLREDDPFERMHAVLVRPGGSIGQA